MKFKNILLISIILIVLGLMIIGVLMRTIASNKCGVLCEDKNALHHQIVPNGKFNLNDLCICYYERGIEVSFLE